jgi:histidine triad (HIT) family protein
LALSRIQKLAGGAAFPLRSENTESWVLPRLELMPEFAICPRRSRRFARCAVPVAPRMALDYESRRNVRAEKESPTVMGADMNSEDVEADVGSDLGITSGTNSAAPYDNNNVFAKILRGELPCHKVYEDEVALAFMDIMPRANGHVLVIPKSPARNILDVDPAVLGALMARVQIISHAALKGLDAEGISVMQFNESAGGQVVFHLHFHIMPRWTGVALRPPGTMGDSDTIKGFRDRIVAAIES